MRKGSPEWVSEKKAAGGRRSRKTGRAEPRGLGPDSVKVIRTEVVFSVDQFWRRVARRSREKGMTLEALARAVGVSRPQLSRALVQPRISHSLYMRVLAALDDRPGSPREWVTSDLPKALSPRDGAWAAVQESQKRREKILESEIKTGKSLMPKARKAKGNRK